MVCLPISVVAVMASQTCTIAALTWWLYSSTRPWAPVSSSLNSPLVFDAFLRREDDGNEGDPNSLRPRLLPPVSTNPTFVSVQNADRPIFTGKLDYNCTFRWFRRNPLPKLHSSPISPLIIARLRDAQAELTIRGLFLRLAPVYIRRCRRQQLHGC
ncbi:hypothetical protein FB45DRAFT_473941 [Roridomyces roridus]|uniref:Uncharacterized protein n=1 Tax=Roridomyces roridus TaxID=1738132 RepID=A0AAD7BZ76_9AGAR|nr:hypothetical protein FB45DRAFT_473941 [Roridomyces roridus]